MASCDEKSLMAEQNISNWNHLGLLRRLKVVDEIQNAVALLFVLNSNCLQIIIAESEED